MKFLKQFLWILLISFLGEALRGADSAAHSGQCLRAGADAGGPDNRRAEGGAGAGSGGISD